MIHLPPLYPLTDPRREASLSAQVRAFGDAGLPLVQFRGKPLDAKVQYEELRKSLRQSNDNGGWPLICVNDRADLAVLAAQEGLMPWGLHLGQTDLPPSEVRRLPGLVGIHIGTSTHNEAEWASIDPACDHAGLGPFRATASKPDHEPPIGLAGLRDGCGKLRSQGIAPIAIGGIGRHDFADVFAAGAESIALISELDRNDPVELAWAAQCERWRAQPALRKGQGLILVGSSGSGKTTLASSLALRLNLPSLDLDQLIEAQTGQNIPQIFEQQGEMAFRSLEGEILRSRLDKPSVIALGGGAWERAEIREAVSQSAFVVLWIAETPQTCWARIAADPNRPLAKDRDDFLARHGQRIQNWCGLSCVLPLGHGPDEIADSLLGAVTK